MGWILSANPPSHIACVTAPWMQICRLYYRVQEDMWYLLEVSSLSPAPRLMPLICLNPYYMCITHGCILERQLGIVDIVSAQGPILFCWYFYQCSPRPQLISPSSFLTLLKQNSIYSLLNDHYIRYFNEMLIKWCKIEIYYPLIIFDVLLCYSIRYWWDGYIDMTIYNLVRHNNLGVLLLYGSFNHIISVLLQHFPLSLDSVW